MPEQPGNGEASGARPHTDNWDAGPPAGLYYLAEAAQVHAVFLPPARAGDQLVAVAEPGRDPAALWPELCAFMDAEGIPHAS